MDAVFTGKEIARRRKDLGLTQKELAEKVHVTDKAVSKWERGINFPDLGLMEQLAAALETTPAVLLGLQEQGQEEIIKSMMEFSQQQLEDTRRQLRLIGVLALAAALLMMVVYRSIKWDSVRAYQILTMLIAGTGVGGIWLLFRSGLIRKFGAGDWLCLYLAVLPVMIYNGAFLFLDHGLPEAVNLVLILISAYSVQLLCYRVMQSSITKALPLLVLPVYLIWATAKGGAPADAGLCGLAFLAAYLICRKRDNNANPIHQKKAAAILLAVLLAFCLLFSDSLIRAGVQIFHEPLERYCEEFLEESSAIHSRSFGPWKATAYPEQGMVEFFTGGFGLAPGSTYEGFYYSEENQHIPFQGAEVPMQDWGDSASWTDGTDNHGSSRRIRDNWFWFEASF